MGPRGCATPDRSGLAVMEVTRPRRRIGVGAHHFPAELSPRRGSTRRCAALEGSAASPLPPETLRCPCFSPSSPNSVPRDYPPLRATYIRFTTATDSSFPSSLFHVKGFLHLISRKGFYLLRFHALCPR